MIKTQLITIKNFNNYKTNIVITNNKNNEIKLIE